MTIDCGTCSAAGAGCSDCVVALLLGPPREVSAQGREPAQGQEPVGSHDQGLPPRLTDEEQRALTVLVDAGLVRPFDAGLRVS